jgi:hypothetical protein
VTQPAQLVVRINGGQLLSTVCSRASGATQLCNDVLITTTSVDSIMNIASPFGNSPAFAITPADGGLTAAPATTLVIKRLA